MKNLINMTDKELDSYNPLEVKEQLNDTHPEWYGYYQMADAYIGAIKYFE